MTKRIKCLKTSVLALVAASVLSATSCASVRKGAATDAGGFRKFLWAELIAFDNTKPDFGVEEYLARSKIKPDAISLLLIESSLFEKHREGLPSDFTLPDAACSYDARPYNSERSRQAWTAFQLRSLVKTINAKGVETYASFFEWGYQDLNGVKPGTDEPYVDFFIRQTSSFLRDYGFTGLHAADGYGHPRKTLAQRSVPASKRFSQCEKWGSFWRKAGSAFRSAGFKTYLNTCWKRDPYEAVTRFGFDYRPVSESDIDGWVVEATSVVMDLEGWNKSPDSSLDQTMSGLLMLGPVMRGKEAVLLFGIKDDLEQYHALYHAPTGAEAEAMATGVATFNGKKILTGITACLSDAVKPGEWDRLDRMWSRAYGGPDVAEPMGARVVWSERAFDRECRELPATGKASSYTLLAGLMNRGAVIGGTVTVEKALEDESMPLIVLNPAFFPEDELTALARRGDRLVRFGVGVDDFTEHPVAVEPKSWLDPLKESRPSRRAFGLARKAINAFSPIVPADAFADIVVSGYRGTDGAWYVVARSNRTRYTEALLTVKRPVGSVGIISDYPSMPVETFLKAKIPPSGVVKLRLDGVIGK